MRHAYRQRGKQRDLATQVATNYGTTEIETGKEQEKSSNQSYT